MRKDERHRELLLAVSRALLERALEAKARKDAAKARTKNFDYDAGRLMAYNEAVSRLRSQAEGLRMDLKALGLDRIEPDRDLV